MNKNFTRLEETIAAISTPVGPGGIGIVRMSGKKALSIADKIFVTKSGAKPSDFKNYTLHYGWVVNPQGKKINNKAGIIDEALLTVMREPRSYTREDMVEVSCHGGYAAVRAVLALMTDLGARLAQPGEFTKRAFLNGRIDLAQAEAVLEIIQAKTESYLKISNQQLKGELSRELEEIRETFLQVYAAMEAVLNFPEEDLDEKGPWLKKKHFIKQLFAQFKSLRSRLKKLIDSGDQGQLLKDGIKLVICGKPNVGKSSLLNVFLKQPRAIVTEFAGTTRDTIEEFMVLKGVPFQIVDTAGILPPRDPVEREAVRRSRIHIEQADMVLLLLDGSQRLSRQDVSIMENVKRQNVLVAINKCDLKNVLGSKQILRALPGTKIFRISATKKTGIAVLEKAIVNRVLQGRPVDTGRITVSNLRHLEALKDCDLAVAKAGEHLNENYSLEFISEDIKRAIQALDQITGRYLENDLVEKIFSSFCVGK